VRLIRIAEIAPDLSPQGRARRGEPRISARKWGNVAECGRRAHTLTRSQPALISGAMKSSWWSVVVLTGSVSCHAPRAVDQPPASLAAAGPAAGLDQLLLDIPCPTIDAPTECDVIESVRKQSKTVRFGGSPGQTYAVKLHFCGPAEGRRYTGCAPGQGNPLVCVDGQTASRNPDDPSYPTYELRVSAPAHSYFLNSLPLYDDIMKIDYTTTVPVQGGSTITLATDGGSNPGIYTSKLNGHNFTCAGVPGIRQPFVGQFIFVTVESVDPPG
jgi:hypothetical protein